MMLTAALVLAFLSGALLLHVALTSFYPPIRERYEAERRKISATLESALYTEYDAGVFVMLKYGGAVIAFIIGLMLLDSFVFGLGLALFFFWIPGVLLERITRKRREAIDSQVGDVMTALSAAIKGGMTLDEAITEIATTMRPPIAQEFALIRKRIDAGQTMVEALRAADARLDAPRISLIFQSIIVSQERGGRLASLMDHLSVAMREIQRVEERIKTETSGLRLSARIMVFLPVVICGFLYIADPAQVEMLFTTIVGNIILLTAVLFDVAAFRIMKKLTDLDV